MPHLNASAVLAAVLPLSVACATPPPAPPAQVGRVEITVTDDGFEPRQIAVAAGQPITLVFERRTENSCLREVVVYLGERETIRRPLPLGKRVEIPVTFRRAGELGYACGMNMFGGTILVRDPEAEAVR